MNNANLYSSSNSLQKNDAKYVIDNYFENIKWLSNGGDISLDIGCGDGVITSELLLNNMPNTHGMIIGTDISSEMIKHATIAHENPKLQFRQLDISTKTLPKQFTGKFDHVFSFYCLHWIQDQRKAYQNIYDLLKPNGDVLVTYLASNPLFSIYESISKLSKWQSYMQDYTKYISPFQKSLYPEKELKQILKSIGFEVELCKRETRAFVYEDLITWRKSVKAVNPFLERIPESKRDEYIDEYLEEIIKRDLVSENNNQIQINAPYELLVVYAQKRL